MQNLVCIRVFSDIWEGRIAKDFLRSNGIDADLFHSGLVSRYGFELSAQARLMVLERQQEKALQILTQVQEEYNRQITKHSLSSNIIQYILILISIIFLSFTDYMGILILAPLSRFIRS